MRLSSRRRLKRSGPRLPDDFGRKRARRVPWRRCLFMALGAALCGAGVFGAIQVSPWVADLPLFAIGSVEVRGADFLSADEIRGVAGVRSGDSIWRLPRAEALGRLTGHPRIERAVVAVRPWTDVVLLVTERRPLALLSGGIVREVAEDGVVLPAVAGRTPTDAPILSGFDGRSDARVAEALRLVEWLSQEDAGLLDSVSEIRPDSTGGLDVYLSEGHYWIRVPVPVERVRTRLRWLRSVVDDLMAHGVVGAVVDLGFEGQIVVRPHPAWAAAADSAYAGPAENNERGLRHRENRRGA